MARAQDDSWDPATGFGTATFGAVARAVATNKGLLADPFAAPLVRAAGVEYFVELVEDARYSAHDPDNAENPTMAQLLDAMSAHTRFLDNFLADAGRAGIRQVVLLASGLDSRPYRLWWPAGTTVYELDMPEVIDFKTEVLRGLGAKLTANHCAVGADLRRDWLPALRRVGFDAAQPTVWIVEQLLLGYLPIDSQNQILRDVTAVSAIGSRFADDHLPTQSDRFLAVDLYLQDNGWETVARTVADLFAAVGMGRLWRGGPDDAAITPRYVTAYRTG
jgi:methyltransferase (TIGR00027 family)